MMLSRWWLRGPLKAIPRSSLASVCRACCQFSQVHELLSFVHHPTRLKCPTNVVHSICLRMRLKKFVRIAGGATQTWAIYFFGKSFSRPDASTSSTAGQLPMVAALMRTNVKIAPVCQPPSFEKYDITPRSHFFLVLLRPRFARICQRVGGRYCLSYLPARHPNSLLVARSPSRKRIV